MGKSKKAGKGKAIGAILKALDMDRRIEPKAYFRKLDDLHDKLREIQQAYIGTTEAAVIVLEGWDTAGKGGAIRRITTAMDPRSVKVWPIASPREYYRERHYLARFWERLPPNGAISIFDRSWYGRVMVERVEEFATPAEWKRAYREINEFERMLTDDGTRVVKFFLHITPDEQLRRFEQRLKDPLKRWKLQYEDFRNREKWDAYEAAIEEMLARTSTKYAPWYVVPSNDKKFSRIEIISRICKRLSAGVDLAPRPLDEQTLAAARKYFDV
jgi:AMP-polyphosphate phosphotransferase